MDSVVGGSRRVEYGRGDSCEIFCVEAVRCMNRNLLRVFSFSED